MGTGSDSDGGWRVGRILCVCQLTRMSAASDSDRMLTSSVPGEVGEIAKPPAALAAVARAVAALEQPPLPLSLFIGLSSPPDRGYVHC